MRSAAGTIVAEQADGVTVVRLSGEIDGALRDQASTAMARALTAGMPVVLDASGTRFVDSRGVAFLIQCARACEQVGLTVTLRDPPAQVRGVIAYLGAEEILPLARADRPGAAAADA